MRFLLPSTPDQMLTWATVLLLWMIANYVVPIRPKSGAAGLLVVSILRVLFPATMVLIVAGFPAWSLAVLLLLAGTMLPAGRAWLAPRRFRAEVELGSNLLLIAGSALLTGSFHVTLRLLPALGVPPGRWTGIYLVSAGAIFLLRGGAEVVRGILEKAESIPVTITPAPGQAIVQEFNRGRLIGYLERLLIMAIIMAGQYAALGVLIAAKGLIRSHELERLDFAEYFLIGTLASITVAFFVGLGLRALVLPLW